MSTVNEARVACTVLSWASAHGRLQLKCQKLRVGCYMKKVLEWSNYHIPGWCKFSHKSLTDLQKKFSYFNFHTHVLACCHAPSHDVSLFGVVFGLRQWWESTRISELLLSMRSCHASVKMATEPTLSLFFCAPCARIKILTSSKFRTEKKFHSLNFRLLKFYAKFCTIRKFPAIRYLHASSHPGCKVSCQGVPNRLTSLLCPCFIEASPTMENAVLC